MEKRREAVLALGLIGQRAKATEAAVPALTAALKGGIASDRMFDAEALWKIKKHPAAAAAMLEDFKKGSQLARERTDVCLLPGKKRAQQPKR